jgi:catechol 2,3-dioxygenase-like lactoylglutathione lyase family enzyme
MMEKPSMLFEVTRTNTILYCRNWAETIAFYRDVLRLSVSYQKDWFIEFHIAGNTYLSVADEQRASINSASGSGITLSWQVTDIAQAHNSLRAQDISATEVERKWGALVCYFTDPEGNRIELWEAPKNI